MTKPNNVTIDQARQNAAGIRNVWRAGQRSVARLQQLQRKDPHSLQHGRRMDTYTQEAQALGTNVDTAAKMRRLAQEYTREQIDTLCALVERQCSRFGPTHLLILLRVDDRARRDRLMKQAVREGWTTAQLERAVQAHRRQRRPHVGRKPRVPADPTERLLALDAVSEKFVRWCELAQADLPAGMRPLIDKATRAVSRVRRAVAKELGGDADA
jgi:hypothetical protein